MQGRYRGDARQIWGDVRRYRAAAETWSEEELIGRPSAVASAACNWRVRVPLAAAPLLSLRAASSYTLSRSSAGTPTSLGLGLGLGLGLRLGLGLGLGRARA